MKEKKIKKFALGVEYDGSYYHGWQRQKGFPTVQEEIETALSKIANHPVNTVCSGRTDAGVHSVGQVIHFTSTSVRSDFSWTVGVNTYLSKNISVKWVKEVSQSFSARYSAISRSYRYIIYNNRCRSAIFSSKSNHVHKKLNIDKMFVEAQSLLGEHNFSSFRALGCQSNSPRRKITNLNVWRLKNWVIIDITANSFLYHMVRNIVGSLIKISNYTEKNCIKKLLDKKDRNYAGPTAPAQGLYLFFVEYPIYFNLPVLKNDFII
ncbi:tRNA pseudouridine(38-40) synthase TruA [Buchnera aphidicola]|uniref:tRNA pseudouridine synthase A n=1 Tax=Buchnera aphidicola subsp. Rhopalosiphum maidis TaxID=118109 RepID=A0A3G2I5Z8_BUCRM|nr:tRNA pseudouridine(38-40) synthase TruA [Buchnera aphidicola]AYN24846.1 tRNA pseudouridine(38-40) synthase TruA [Buchnera aphidicola (Rhopalosiphum maidis)]